MSCRLILFNNQEIMFQPGPLPDYNGPVLAGATTLSCKNDFLECIFQKITGDGYTIQFSITRFFEKVAGTGIAISNGLYSRFMLKNGLRHDLPAIGKIHLRQDQFSVIHGVPGICKIIYESAKDYQALDIYYSPQLLEQLLPFFPELKELINKEGAVLVQNKAFWMIPPMQEIVKQILNCPYDEATRQFYFDMKVREMLFLIFQISFKHPQKSYQFTPWETARIHHAREILSEYVSKKPLSTRALSKKVAINEFKLKTGFKQFFNIGIFEWLMEAKMQKAKELLLTTNKPIKDICTLVGYPRTTNFITAFRRRFGQTPGSLRRN